MLAVKYIVKKINLFQITKREKDLMSLTKKKKKKSEWINDFMQLVFLNLLW